jgi:hypothetical protein
VKFHLSVMEFFYARYFLALTGASVSAENIEANAATSENVAGKAITAKEFVHALDRRLAELNRMSIGFDATKLPSTTAFKVSRNDL